MSTRVLLTGFEPFGGDQRNPSLEAVRIVEKLAPLSGVTLSVHPLAVEFVRSRDQLCQLISEVEPDIVVCVGLAAGRMDVSFERVAINLADARIPDNAGSQPVDAELIKGGPAARFTSLPVKDAVLRVREAGLPASLSYSAGTYVCNAAMYYVLDILAGTDRRGGFIHVPDAFAANPAMTIEQIAQAIHIAVDAFMNVEQESLVSMGREH